MIENIIIEIFAANAFSSRPGEMWKIEQDADGAFLAVSYVDPAFMTMEDRTRYIADTLEDLSVDEIAWRSEPEPRWPTLELAREWAALQDAFTSVGDEMSAYHAPSECAPAAYEPLEAEERALLAQQFRKPTPGPLWPFTPESEN